MISNIFFFECDDVKLIWNEIIPKLESKFSLPRNFNTYQSLILGCSAAPPIVNLILLLIKQYIVNSKLSTDDIFRTPRISCVMEMLSRQSKAEKITAKNQNKLDQFHKKWGMVLDVSGNVALGSR